MRNRIASLALAAFLVPAMAPTGRAEARGGVQTMSFGKMPDGTPVHLFVLTNGRITAKVTDFGAILTELDVPDRQGKPANVVLGFDDLAKYLAPIRSSARPSAAMPTGSPGVSSRSTARTTTSP